MWRNYFIFTLFFALPYNSNGRKITGSPRVCIDTGCLRGTVMQDFEGSSFDAFLGIPYAKPPVGVLRFAVRENPVPNDRWFGEYDATKVKSKCVQKNDLRPVAFVEGSEDCLYLYVYRPRRSTTTPLPVMVFIHGGAYFSGTTLPSEIGPEYFMANGSVILVAMQYRLGVFGFLSTGDCAATGNFAMKDQALALKWVNRSIASFGGDPTRVTLFGQSVGASSVMLQMMNKGNEGLFSRAIMMSGSALADWSNVPHEDLLQMVQQQALAVGLRNAANMTTFELIESLRDVDALELGRSIDRIKSWSVFPFLYYHPTIENCLDGDTFLNENPADLWANGRYMMIPWMTSNVPVEGLIVMLKITLPPGLLQQFIDNYKTLIPLLTSTEEAALSQLKNRFFPDSSKEVFMTLNDSRSIERMVSESGFRYPMVLTVKQHLAKGDLDKAPVVVYYFNFKGRYSHSQLYSWSYKDYGVCHEDDLLYLFRSPALFPDFPEDSPERGMCREFVNFMVGFALEGRTPKEFGLHQPCTAERCPMLELTNSRNDKNPLQVNSLYNLDEDMFQFWDRLLNA